MGKSEQLSPIVCLTAPLNRLGLGSITEAYYSFYPEKKNTETVYCFFDEIQAVEGWEPFVDRLMRTEKCEVYITGSLYSINSLTRYLKSLGHKSPKSAVSEYLEWFEDAYFLFTVRIFDASLARSKINPKKIYCVDHAMVTSVASGILINTGHLLENLVFTALRRVTPDIWYCKTKGGLKVDSLTQSEDRSRMLVQVCESMAEPQTRKRELAALTEAMAEYGLKSGTVVIRNEEDQIKVGAGKIELTFNTQIEARKGIFLNSR